MKMFQKLVYGFALFFGVLLLGVSIISIIGRPPSTVTATAEAAVEHDCPSVTFEQFKALRMGATYEEATSVLGCEGREMSRFEVPGAPQFASVLYTWDTGRFLSSMSAMFQGNRMISKSQIGLSEKSR